MQYLFLEDLNNTKSSHNTITLECLGRILSVIMENDFRGDHACDDDDDDDDNDDDDDDNDDDDDDDANDSFKGNDDNDDG